MSGEASAGRRAQCVGLGAQGGPGTCPHCSPEVGKPRHAAPRQTSELVLSWRARSYTDSGGRGWPTTVSQGCLQPAPPSLGAGVSPCSTVLPEMVRAAPVAWVISTLRGWLRDDAGIV